MKILLFFSIIGILVIAASVKAQSLDDTAKSQKCDDEEYSYLASIVLHAKHPICTGSFLSPRWVLTAGHCCEEMKLKRKKWFSVFGGQSAWLRDVEQVSRVNGMYIHEDSSTDPVSSDICLIRLSTAIRPSPKVRISKLATTQEFEEMVKNNKCDKALIMGFGTQVEMGAASKLDALPPQLVDSRCQCLNARVLGGDRCQGDSFYGKMLSDSAFCVDGPARNDIDTCQADSGGPVYCGGLQIGVVSSGIGCRGPGYPGFYTRVDLFKDYIEMVMMLKERDAETVNVTSDKRVADDEMTAKADFMDGKGNIMMLERRQNETTKPNATGTGTGTGNATTGKPASGSESVGFYKILLLLSLILMFF